MENLESKIDEETRNKITELKGIIYATVEIYNEGKEGESSYTESVPKYSFKERRDAKKQFFDIYDSSDELTKRFLKNEIGRWSLFETRYPIGADMVVLGISMTLVLLLSGAIGYGIYKSLGSWNP